jgi:hypothetical protein
MAFENPQQFTRIEDRLPEEHLTATGHALADTKGSFGIESE